MATQAHADLNPVPTTCTIACGGSSNACKGSTQPADVSETHPIRCCSDVEKPGWMKRDRCDIWSQTEIDGVCHSAVTFFEAVVICAKAGGRVCTKDELLNDCTRGSGCGTNAGMVWSADTWAPCVTDAECEDGLECTTNTCGGDGICVVTNEANCLQVTACGSSEGSCKNWPLREADPPSIFTMSVAALTRNSAQNGVTDAECEDGLECTTNTCGGDGICQVNDVSNCLIATGCGALDGNCSHRPQRKADPAFHFHHVRCCSDSPLPGFVLNPTCSSTVGTVYGASEVGPPGEECQELKTYDEAVAACDAVEARLCTADELLNDCTADTGCGFDNRISWTSTVLA
eukprot:CAMPEP_0184476362 /NCGR_PEP_ID=MMETSP0740-20130409/147045_1 /TAXON_ID=385413 /ORGANISM="Thalassiosira miniscula, Strain CCMP1093" /LENGTH=344 /DNA_ID=CAMNT_0026853917 /DNA_START=146 /DNA_END=1181 /DNA_ORIENTATION=+